MNEFKIKTNPFKTCKTLTQKDSSLVIANTKGGYFSAKDRIAELGETFDFDVFRYRNVATVITTNNDKFNSIELAADCFVVWFSIRNKQLASVL